MRVLNRNTTICSFRISLANIHRLILEGLLALVFSGLAATGAYAQASNVYITQDGGGNGVCSSNVHNPAWFNSSANWGTSASQIGPGTIVHLCGTFNAPAGANSYLRFQGSGTSGNPITLLFENGAIVQAPYFSANNGGIDVNGQQWIVVDGGTNGILQNTAEGTGLTYQQDTALIKGMGNNFTVKNLSMLNVYVHQIGDDGGGGPQGWAFAVWGQSSNLTIGPNNTFTQCNVCAFYAFQGGEQNLVITGNNFSLSNQAIELGPGNSGTKVMTNIQVDHNTYVASRNWDNAANYYHHNFFHPFTCTAGSSIVGNLLIFDNTVTGDVGQHSTSMIFLENNNGGSGGTMGSWYIFNNTFNKTNTDAPGSSGIVAVMSANGFFLNNTVVDAGGSGNYAWPSFNAYGGATGWTVQNNIFYGGAYQIDIQAPATVNANKNVYYGGIGGSPWVYHSTFTGSFSTWQAACSCDSGSSISNPLLNSDMTISAGSAASTLGANLSSMNITALNFDKVGTARPSGSWSSGAIQLGSASAQIPKPPTGLAATVN
ncbi:MAG TPA: hypothetical protein VLA42_16760 [Verrucomicrobiae bacterium]|nr:hypothetical protein [Verrucomicrobiae bacterium]